MCIIACKPIGLQMPDEDTITSMWYNNPDGAGIMYAYKGSVHIEKGFMSLDKFLAAIERINRNVDLANCGVVMHFRITTHGGTSPENTHPFPISASIPALKKLVMKTDVGVAHNGIIHNTPRSKDISDTMEYIASQLAPLKAALPRFWENKNAMLLVKNAIDSKMAFLDSAGGIHTIGDFVEHDGMLYSNRTYEDYWVSFKHTSYYGWEFDGKKWSKDTYTTKHPTAMVANEDEFYDMYGDHVSPHYLMPIMDVDGSYYAGLDGQLYEDTNYEVFIDKKGRAWTMDWEVGVAYKDDTIMGVYDSTGMRLRFQEELAEFTDCYDYEEGLLYFPYKDGDF